MEGDMRDFYYETTPYGVTERGGKFYVEQTWWAKIVSPAFTTRKEAEDAVVEKARKNRCLKKRYI